MSARSIGVLAALALSCLISVARAQPAHDDPVDVVAALENRVADAIARVQPSIVAITRIPSENGETTAIKGQNPLPPGPPAEEVAPDFNDIRGERVRPGFPNGAAPEYLALPGEFGGGVVIGEQGEILTTYHLLKGAARLRVRAPGAAFDAEILAADPRMDLAVIVPRPGATLPKKLPPVALGDASKLRQGAFLIALGNPFNSARDGRASASLGILSNMARRLEPPQGQNINIRQFFKFQATLMQLDSRLNLGMSGGAVINLKGELVGITTSEASPSGYDAAAGYAIPLDTLGRRAVGELVQGKEVEYGFIGIGLGPEPNTVRQVERDTPAWKANLATNDRILAVGDITLADDESALQLALASVPVGQTVRLRVLHEGKEVERTLVMSKYPVMGEAIATNRPPTWRGLRVDFTSVLSRRLETDDTLKTMSRGGVGVVEVEPQSPAASAGLNRGQVVLAVNGQDVSTPSEFRAAVQRADGSEVTLTLAADLREGKRIVVPAK
jgi:S1-C subfamily serine protease